MSSQEPKPWLVYDNNHHAECLYRTDHMPDTTFCILEGGRKDLEMQEERKGDGEEEGKGRKREEKVVG